MEARKPLKGVVCIFDIRRVPNQLDLDLLGYLHALGRHIWLVLNKADKISQPKRQKQVLQMTKIKLQKEKQFIKAEIFLQALPLVQHVMGLLVRVM